MHNNCVMYIVAVQLYFGQFDGCFVYWCSYSVLWVILHSYKLKIPRSRAEQCRCNNMRLTESKNTRSEQLLLMPTEQLAENGCQENSWMDWNVRRPGWYFGYEISKWEMERGNWGGRERHWSTRIVDEEIATFRALTVTTLPPKQLKVCTHPNHVFLPQDMNLAIWKQLPTAMLLNCWSGT